MNTCWVNKNAFYSCIDYLAPECSLIYTCLWGWYLNMLLPIQILAFSHTLNLEQLKIIGDQMSKKGKIVLNVWEEWQEAAMSAPSRDSLRVLRWMCRMSCSFSHSFNPVRLTLSKHKINVCLHSPSLRREACPTCSLSLIPAKTITAFTRFLLILLIWMQNCIHHDIFHLFPPFGTLTPLSLLPSVDAQKHRHHLETTYLMEVPALLLER